MSSYLWDTTLGEERAKRQGGGNLVYSTHIISILEAFWKAAGCLWSHRLKAALPLWMPWICKHFSLTWEEEQMLLAMSPSTMDRRLKDKKDQARKRLYGTTKPGKWLRHQIPIQIEPGKVRRPGYTEMDLVSHSGPNSSGDFAHTLNKIDIFSCWVCRRAILTKAEIEVTKAMDDMQEHIPFALRGVHVDNGSEFINAHLWRYCRGRKIRLTRSRARKKDDNAHIEQKNGTHVRQLLGYVRYDSQEAVDAMNDLYRNELDIFQNLFQPSVKLIRTVRRGSKSRRIYDKPKTPLDRLIESKQGIASRVAALQKLRDQIDPFQMSQRIDRKLERIYSMSSEIRKISTPRQLNLAFLNGTPELGEHWVGPFVDSPLKPYAKRYYRDSFFQTRT